MAKLGDDGDRARKSVSNAIARAIGIIEKQRPALARHLDHSIRMGQFLSYSPEVPVDWAT